jgi:hypothetical protein
VSGKRKKPKIHTDARGHFVWDYYFVGGRQRRSKRRVTVIGGEIVETSDDWLLANADDVFFHECERWDLIEQRSMETDDSPIEEKAMKPLRRIKLRIEELEAAFDVLATGAQRSFFEATGLVFLDLTTGEVRCTEDEGDLDGDENILPLPGDLFESLDWGMIEAFVDSLEKSPVRNRLSRAIQGKGAFRRFRDIVFGGGDVELRHRWLWFETRGKRERIVQWLCDQNIEPDWDQDIFQAPPLPDKRGDLLRAVSEFVAAAAGRPEVRRIALIGSLASDKAIPKDVDLLVEVVDDMPLAELARLARRMNGKTMATGDGCGAEVFLHDPQGRYLGRICKWKECGPGIRRSCPAQHCGRREYVNDDFQSLRLKPDLIQAPPLELWPCLVERVSVPDDVRRLLIEGRQ